jgi:hypothetical protein
MTLASFKRELYRSRLTLKGLETDTLYLVFKHRSPNCIWIALQTTQTRPQANGDINQRALLCQAAIKLSPTLFSETDFIFGD